MNRIAILAVLLLAGCERQVIVSPAQTAYCRARFAAAKTAADTVAVLDGITDRGQWAAPEYFCEYYLVEHP